MSELENPTINSVSYDYCFYILFSHEEANIL